MGHAMTTTALAPHTARPHADPALRLGPVASSLPVVLAPMAGITNAAYRRLCREQAEAGVADVQGPARTTVRRPMRVGRPTVCSSARW